MFIRADRMIINSNNIEEVFAKYDFPEATETGLRPGDALLKATLISSGDTITLWRLDHDEMPFIEWLLHRIMCGIRDNKSVDLEEIGNKFPSDEEMIRYGLRSDIMNELKGIRDREAGFSFGRGET